MRASSGRVTRRARFAADAAPPLASAAVSVRKRVGRGLQRAWAWAANGAAINATDPAGRRFRRMGPTSCLAFPQGAIYNEEWIELGNDTILGPYVCLTAGMAPGQDLGPDAIIRIGDRVRIGRGSHIVGHHSISIEDDVITGPYVYITDQNHVYADTTVPI